MDYQMNKKYNILYLTENLINNKIYIGVHSTDILEDGYLGSGKHLKRAIKKYGKINFKRCILLLSDDIDLVYRLENSIVTQEFVKRKDNYNIEIGGNKVQHSIEVKLKISVANTGKIFSEETKKKQAKVRKGKFLLADNYNAKKVINTKTGIIYETLKEVSILENINYSTFKWAIKHSKSCNYAYLNSTNE